VEEFVGGLIGLDICRGSTPIGALIGLDAPVGGLGGLEKGMGEVEDKFSILYSSDIWKV
jgi:hypothetical protein